MGIHFVRTAGSAQTGGGGGGSAPAWFTSLSHKQWAQPVGNTIQSVLDPLATVGNNYGSTGPSSIINTWVGAVVDQTNCSMVLLGNGGHDDYYGNEVYAVNIKASSPLWIRRRNASVATPTKQVPAQNQIMWADGRPTSDHTGFLNIEAEGKYYKCGLGSDNYLGDAAGSYWWSYDPAVDDYTYLGNTFGDDNYGISGCALFDSVNREIIRLYANRTFYAKYYALDTLTETYSANTNVNSNGPMNAGLDTTNRVVLIWTPDFGYFVINLANRTADIWASQITVTGTAPTYGNAPLWWHAPSSAFVTWDGAQGFMKLTPTLGNPTYKYSSAAWSSVAGAGGSTPPNFDGAQVSGGMYTKVGLIRDMGDGTAALVVVPRWSAVSDVWVARLTGAI